VSIIGEAEANGKLVQDVLMELGDGAHSEGIPLIKTSYSSSRYCHPGPQPTLFAEKNFRIVL
jgi:hypothetical protein